MATESPFIFLEVIRAFKNSSMNLILLAIDNPL